jgi:diapolycopene oxygenase
MGSFEEVDIMKSVVVVGAGAGGLASSVLLAHAGFKVTLLEKNERIGGKLNREDINGFVFDTGPSILTLPGVLKEIFRLTGADVRDYLELVELDPQWRCWFNDGSRFDFRAGEEGMIEEVRRLSPGDVEGFRNLLLKSRELYRISEDNFFFRDIGGVMDLIKMGNLSSQDSLKLVTAIEPHRRYSDLIDRHIQSPQLRQALEHLPQYVGSSPFLAPAILACLVHVQFSKGCWYPMGGMNQISEALAKRFQELGGEVVLNSEVKEIYRDGRSIRGVETADGRLWTADEYVVNADKNSMASKMGLKEDSTKQLACSGVTVFFGLSKKAENLAHHNFYFSQSHQAEFADIYSNGQPHQDPTIYACVPSITDPSVAPKGKENIFLLIHAPIVNGKTDWDQYLPEYVTLVEKKLARLGLDIESLGVEVRKARSPKGIGEKWGTFHGNIYGVASHGRLAGGFKKKNSSSEFHNLQYAGGTVNPGAGVPMSLMSGMIAGANLIQRQHSLQEIRL